MRLPSPGDVVAGRFEVEQLAAEGGMGLVYRARDRSTQQQVALKVINQDNPELARRFRREAAVLASLDHPAIVRYVAHGATLHGQLYLAMEWLGGRTLDEHVDGRGMEVAESIALVARIARAVGAAHDRDIIHRDIKPSNILIVGGDVRRAVLVDFGIARDPRTDSFTRTGQVVGSPQYMAPEQARGHRQVDPRADVYSLGCVLYHCLTGHPPFEADQLVALLAKIILEPPPAARDERSEVPRELDALLARMLAKDPDDRLADGHEVARELEGAAAGVAAVPSSPSSLTSNEQLLLCVLMLSEVEREVATAETMPGHAPDNILPEVARAYGGRLEVLADGSIVVTLAGASAATDQADIGVRCLMALRELVPNATGAMAIGRGELSRGLPVGEVVERAAALITSPAAHRTPPPVLVDELTVGLLGSSYELVDLDGVIALGDARDHGDATVMGRSVAFVGRRREIGVLRSTYDECVEDEVARAVLVTGAPGTGKSRLVRELRGEVDRNTAVWSVRGEPVGAESPFRILAGLLEHEAKIAAGDEPAVAAAKLRARIERNLIAPDGEAMADALGIILGLPRSGYLDVDVMVRRDQMVDAFTQFLAAELRVRPLVMLVDDVQWGDVASLMLLEAALRRLREQPLMLVLAGRDDALDLPLDFVDLRMRLDALAPRASARLARTLADDLSDEVVDRLVVQSSGNPLYLEELVRAQSEQGDGRVPDTVLAMMQSRLERLDPELRRALRAASVYGSAFWTGGVDALLASGAPVSAASLRQLGKLEIIEPLPTSRVADQLQYRFRNDVMRQAAYGTLTKQDRRLAHGLAGEWLEGAGERDPVVLAEHFTKGAVPERARRWYRDAASRALDGNDLSAAVLYAKRGVEAGATDRELGELQLIIADACNWRGELAEGRTMAQEAFDALEQGPSWYRAGALVAAMSRRLGDFGDRPKAIAQRMLEHPYRPGDALARARALARTAGHLLLGGHPDLGRRLLDEAEGEAAQGDAPLGAAIAEARAIIAHHGGDVGAYLGHMTTVVQQHLRAGAPRHACGAQVNLGYAARDLGSFERSAEVLREAMATAERLGMKTIVAAAKHNLGFTLALQGQLDEAERHEREAIAAFDQVPVMKGASQTFLALILLERGQLQAAELEARAALWTLADFSDALAHARAVLATVLLEAGGFDEAMREAEAGMTLLDRGEQMEDGEARLRLVYARALAARGQREKAAAAAASARRRLEERAALIEDEELRRTFLERIPENAATIALGGDDVALLA